LPIGTRRPASSRGEVLAEHAVIVHLTLAGGEMGSPDERAEIATLQEEVSAVIDAVGVGEFDGDEWGGNECVLYMYGEECTASNCHRVPARMRSSARGTQVTRTPRKSG
jgi:hypothetical protein